MALSRVLPAAIGMFVGVTIARLVMANELSPDDLLLAMQLGMVAGAIQLWLHRNNQRD